MKLEQLIRRDLVRVFLIAFAIAVTGTWLVQDALISAQTRELLDSNQSQLRRALAATSDAKMLGKAWKASELLPRNGEATASKLRAICARIEADELNLCDSNGVIVCSTVPEYVGFVMKDHDQSRPFCKLLGELREYAQEFGPIGYDAKRFRKYVGVALASGGFLELGFDEDRYLPIPDLSAGRHLSAAMMAAMLLAVFVAVFTLLFFFFRNRIVAPIRRANESLARIAAGKLDEKVLSGGSTEMDALAEDINVTVDRLRGFIDEAAHRADAELAMAKAIQVNALPSTVPPNPSLADRLDIYACMSTAKEVGGDFYDLFLVGTERLAFVIADVAGKGVPAALFMMRAKATIQGLLRSGTDIVEAVGTANDRLAESNDANLFVTAWVGVVDLATGQVDYVNAGHNPPLVKRTDGSVEYLRAKSGPPLAAMGGVAYRRQSLTLAPGDGIVLYTDGITEAANKSLELYGEERLRTALLGLIGAKDARDVLAGIQRDVDAFAVGTEQADDITLLALKLIGSR